MEEVSRVAGRRSLRPGSPGAKLVAVLGLVCLLGFRLITAGEDPSEQEEELRNKIATSEGEQRLLAEVELGDLLVAAGRLEEAELIFLGVRSAPFTDSGRTFEPEGLYGLGTVFESRGHYVTAMEYYLKALAVAEEEGHSYIISAVHNSMGNIRHFNGDIAGALESYQSALSSIASQDDPVGTAQVYGNIADLYRQKQDYAEAHRYLDSAVKLLRGAKVSEGNSVWGFLSGNRGQVLVAEGRSREAIRALHKGVDINRQTKDNQSLAGDLVQLGLAYASSGQPERAIKLIREGVELAEQIRVQPIAEEGLRALSKVYRDSGDCALALENQVKASELREELVNQQTASRSADLRELYRTTRKEKEIELLRAERALAELKAREAQASRNQLIVASLVGLAALLFVCYQYRQKSRVNRLIRAKREELELAYEKLEELARTDTLTGLINRRALLEIIENEMTRARRTERSFCMALIDIDHFKFLNDQHGHACGDMALKTVADRIQSQLRANDSCARWGGEEFLILLPETDLEGGCILAERVRQEVASNRIRYEGQSLELTLTIGISLFELDDNLDSCLRKADRALYRGKNSGRNQVVAA